MRIMISDALRTDPDIEVVGTANNGKEGAEKTRTLNPDVVITDMVMPEYDGLYAVKNIMRDSPTPIILLSSLNKTTPEVFDALNAGAFDFIDKPQTKDSHEFKNELGRLTEKIKVASGLDSGVLGKKTHKTNHHQHSFTDVLQYDILVIGASTGGPSAIESIISQLPANLAIPVIIVQHMPERFLKSFAQRLDNIVPLPVRLARSNTSVKPGKIYIIPGDGNMELKEHTNGQRIFKYSKRKFKEYDSPSVDCLFESVAHVYGSKSIAVVLTGMGKDGSNGLLKIRNNGGLTIAQDSSSCVVNGMPKAAIERGAIDYIVKLREIPGFVMSCF